MTRMVKAVVESVRRNIASGLYKPGTFVPSETELAVELEVSRGTIRKALEYLVEAGDIARRPHSRPVVPTQVTPRISQSEPGRSEIHVWVSSPIGEEPSLYFLKGLSGGFSGSRFRIVVREPSRAIQEVVQREERAFFSEVISSREAAGAIVIREPHADNLDLVLQVQAMGKHIVFVDSAPPTAAVADHVGTANSFAARTAVEHLIGQGHQDIAFLVDTLVPSPTRDRAAGYSRAMDQAGLSEFKMIICAEELPPSAEANHALAGSFTAYLKHGPFFSEVAWRLAKELLVSPKMPTALFVAYDILAYWICAYLEAAGVRIPQDIAVVGFDNLARWQPGADNLLTSASQDFVGFGLHAANLIMDRIEGTIPPAPRTVLLDAPLVIRGSSSQEKILPAFQTSRASAGLNPDDLMKHS